MNYSHRSSSPWGARAAWLGAFVLSVALFSAGLTCAVPLVAFAAICALRQSRAQALLFMAVLWLADELIAFTLLGFPARAVAFGWAGLIGAAILAATWAASAVAQRSTRAGGMLAVFATAFAVYEGVMWAVSSVVGAAHGAFTAGILLQVLALNAVTFAALLFVGALSTRTAARASRMNQIAHAPQRAA